MRRFIQQWLRNRRIAHIGYELERIWAERAHSYDYERALMREHQALQSADLNAKLPTCRGRHGY